MKRDYKSCNMFIRRSARRTINKLIRKHDGLVPRETFPARIPGLNNLISIEPLFAEESLDDFVRQVSQLPAVKYISLTSRIFYSRKQNSWVYRVGRHSKVKYFTSIRVGAL